MRRRVNAFFAALGLLLSVATVGCSQQKICAPGTFESNGECLADAPDGLLCGPGTEQVGNQCVVVGDAQTDGTGDPDAMPDADAGLPDAEADAVPDADADAPVDVIADADAVDVTADADADGTAGDADLPGLETDDGADVAADADAVDAGPDTPVCQPVCVGKECGDDGCGGVCGTCDDPANPVCDTLFGQCVPLCVPDCLGKACGDDGCGGVCGTCGADATCANDQCLPDSWSCDVTWFAAVDACDCNCGGHDPDCDLPDMALAGCGPGETCDAGVCQGAPPEWTCQASTYNAFDNCDCGCGAWDPDCDDPSYQVLGCLGDDPVCLPDGTCEACVPDCTNKACGDDGCGGVCGQCDQDSALTACVAGTCVDPCGAQPVVCLTSVCGDDGCGGSCGTCDTGETCTNGQCLEDDIPPDPASCAGYCGSVAPAGCYCAPGCLSDGTCCADYEAECGCTPDCSGKNCGGDGCGGSCGTCSGATPYCGDDQNCTATCTPDCDEKSCGDDGCGGTCGTCAAGESCALTNECVPDAWTCPLVYYNDDVACDCGCGVQDPDCDGQTYVLGCPSTSTTCTDGVCDVTFCDANSDCPNQWCTGSYGTGDGTLGGVCSVPDPQGAPPGTPCLFHEECASTACVDGRCRWWCTSDADCAPDAGTCVGLLDQPSGVIQVGGLDQVASVCDLLVGSGAECDSQALCGFGGESCLALIEPVTLGPMYVCGPKAQPNDIGANCEVSECLRGLVCATPSGGGAPVCTVPCPAGDTDCGAGETCTPVPFHEAGTTDPSDDPMVPVCLPN